MPRCAVKSCMYYKTANCTRDKKKLHLFRFPKDHDRNEVWRALLNLKKEDIFTTSCVCHLHFSEKWFDYEKSPFRLHLKRDAIPILKPEPVD
ncbi:hypothetical protein NQ317_004585 [Molorchus minor]|uniref:THAP-type domain-containing protein n=1 Tax=Molorchus minor TaxID=1323400 RepID=A0ABQ9JZ84_9CUCU|nr:hypothetical protein NQ317_004585 [Molorchus minor]